MAMLTLSVPNELLRRAKARLGKGTKADLQKRLVQILESIAMEGEPLDKETEAKVLEGLESPLLKITERDWQAKLRRFDARHRKSKRG